MKAADAQAEADELRAALLVEHAELAWLFVDLRNWQVQDYPKICELILAGLRKQDAATAALQQFLGNIEAAYTRCQALREAEPLCLSLPPTGDVLPREMFPGWTQH